MRPSWASSVCGISDTTPRSPSVAWVYAVLAYVGQLTALGLGVFGFNLFGDFLRDALDPKLRRKS